MERVDCHHADQRTLRNAGEEELPFCAISSRDCLFPRPASSFPPGITSPLIPAHPLHLSSARPFLPRGGVSDPAPVAAGGDRRPRRRNLLPRAIATRVRPPSRGAVRETRRHYDRLCVWRTVRALGSRRARQGEAKGQASGERNGWRQVAGRARWTRPFSVLRKRRAFRVQPTRPPPSARFAGAETGMDMTRRRRPRGNGESRPKERTGHDDEDRQA